MRVCVHKYNAHVCVCKCGVDKYNMYVCVCVHKYNAHVCVCVNVRVDKYNICVCVCM